MLDKELEILKHIEELYKKDVTEQEFLELVKGKETQLSAWREAFKDYYLHDVINVIDEFYVKKNNRTPPRIPQIIAMLKTQNVMPESQVVHHEILRQTYGMEFADMDAKEGNMNWLVPEYIEVEKLIRSDYYPFVVNIYAPSYEEFRECMRRHSMEVRGKEYHVLSSNDIKNLPYAERKEYEDKAKGFNLTNLLKRL